MGYDPIAWRQKRKRSQWASHISDIPEKTLESQAVLYLTKQQEIPYSATASDVTTFTILVGFHSHLDYFEDCINAIALAAKRSEGTYIELLLVNDDPSVETGILERIVDQTDLRFQIRSNQANLGICRSINEALPHAMGDWILHVDCDDQLHPDAIISLRREIETHPGCRFISSRAIDIDHQGRVLAYRLRHESPVELIHNNFASHLKAIRRDLHLEIGGFNPLFEGCQDFEFALRTAMFERLLFIPDYLYKYRWHKRSQTVGNCDLQNEIMIAVRQTYLLAIQWILNGLKGVRVHPSGKHAEEWAKKIPKQVGDCRWHIDLEANSPFSQNLYKLLLIRIAGKTVQATSNGVFGKLPNISI
jgi:glycosyltransferase involved in cell wall biosynthesis